MARIRRQINQTGFYHVMMRGNEKREIFNNDRDRKKLLDIMRLSIREIADFLGLNRGIVQRVVSQKPVVPENER